MKPEVLLRMRERAGLTQGELAERLEVTQGTISNAERGHRGPSLELLEGWAKACGYEVVTLPTYLAEQADALGLGLEQEAPRPAWGRPFGDAQIDLKAMRTQAGLTQRALAEALEMDQSYLSRMERGVREIDLALAQRWARACGHEIAVLAPANAEFLRKLGAMTRHDQQLMQMLIHGWAELPDARREQVRMVIRGLGDWQG